MYREETLNDSKSQSQAHAFSQGAFEPFNEPPCAPMRRPVTARPWFDAPAGVAPQTPATVNRSGPNPRKNRLLAALPDLEWRRLHPSLELIEMPLGMVLSESGGSMAYMYFPTTAVVSLFYVMEDGACAEIAVIGNDGLVGVSLLMGSASSPNRSVVQTAGLGFRLKASTLKEEFDRAGPVLNLLLRYTQALITQTSQTAVCNRHHSLDQQFCRRLLLSLDRQADSEIVVTQERIANMLGVRREGVTAAALRLQQSGLINYSRGRIRVLDRSGLEKRSCECYAVVRKEYDRLLPSPQPPLGNAAESNPAITDVGGVKPYAYRAARAPLQPKLVASYAS